MLIACVVQTVLDDTVRKNIPTNRPKTSGKSGRIQKLIADNIRPPCDEEDDWTEMPMSGVSKCG